MLAARLYFVTISITAVAVGASSFDPLNLDDVRRIAAEVEAKASAEEIAVLRSLLQERGEWHPQAPKLLSQVLSRDGINKQRRLQAASCRGMSDNATCTSTADDGTSCMACQYVSSSCNGLACSDYTTNTSCCANAGKVKDGCFWNPTGDYTDGGVCVELNDCSEMAKGQCGSNTHGEAMTNCPEAEAGCNAITGCSWGACGGCQKSGMTCTCDTDADSTTCVQDGVDAMVAMTLLTETLSGNSACPITDCSLCLKRGGQANIDLSATRTCDELAAIGLTGACSARCGLLIHDDAEAQCFVKRTPGCTTLLSNCQREEPPTSCQPRITVAAPPTCQANCDSFNAACPSTTAPIATCPVTPAASAASGVMVQTAKFISSMAAMLAFLA